MRQTTIQRHEVIRERLDKRADELKRQYVVDFVRVACRELSHELGYTETTLRQWYYRAGG